MCHHYLGQKVGTIQMGFSQLKVNWWSTLKMVPIQAYPLSTVAVLRLSLDDEWIAENRVWGLLPKSWKPGGKIKTATAFQRGKINARSESINTTWPWKLAWRQRCVLIANGFCEPHIDGGEGLYTLPGHETFAIPGLWDTFQGEDGSGNKIAVDSCVMLTTDANELVAAHRTGRMRQPALLTDVEQIAQYCSHENTEYEQISDLFRPFPADAMQMEHVPKKPKNDSQKSLF